MTRAKDVKGLAKLADERKDSALQQVAEWLRDVRLRLEKVDGGSITSAVAFGTSLEKVDHRPRRERARWGGEHYVEVLIVTPREDTFALEDELAEKVFGPIFCRVGASYPISCVAAPADIRRKTGKISLLA